MRLLPRQLAVWLRLLLPWLPVPLGVLALLWAARLAWVGPVLLAFTTPLAVLAAAAAAFAAGLLPYAYLPLRSRSDPALDWGNPETLDAFFAVVTRRDFWERRWIESPADALAIAGDWLASFPRELAWAGVILALVGLASAMRRRRAPGDAQALALLALFAMLGNLIVLALHGSRSDLFLWHRYYIPSYLFGALLAASGVQALADTLPSRFDRQRRALPILLLALPLWHLASGWRAHDRSSYRLAEKPSRRYRPTSRIKPAPTRPRRRPACHRAPTSRPPTTTSSSCCSTSTTSRACAPT